MSTHQRRLLSRLLDPALAVEQSRSTPPRYYLVRWNGSANALLARPAASTVAPLVAAGYLRPMRRPEWPPGTWWTISPAGRAALQAEY